MRLPGAQGRRREERIARQEKPLAKFDEPCAADIGEGGGHMGFTRMGAGGDDLTQDLGLAFFG